MSKGANTREFEILLVESCSYLMVEKPTSAQKPRKGTAVVREEEHRDEMFGFKPGITTVEFHGKKCVLWDFGSGLDGTALTLIVKEMHRIDDEPYLVTMYTTTPINGHREAEIRKKVKDREQTHAYAGWTSRW